MNSINQEEYYERIKRLNIVHYAGETSYYSKAPLRKVESTILSDIKPKSHILDLGCGSGRFSVGAAEMGHTVVGMDITPEAVAAAKKKAGELKNVSFVVGDMTNIPFEDNTFDFVFCPRFSINAVATFDKRQTAVREMLRVVKPGGTVFVESFNKLYLGRGPFLPLKNILTDIWRKALITYHVLFGRKYSGYLSGDIVYEANKTPGASIGYAHLPTIFELRKLVPKNTKKMFYSIPQIVDKKRIDLYRYFRYSIWILLKK